MPKGIARALALLLLLALAGCGSGSKQPTTPTPEPAAPQPAPAPEPVKSPNPEPELPPAEFLHAKLSEWGGGPEWLALDDENRLVAGGRSGSDRVWEWFQEERTERVITRVKDDYVLVTRNDLQRWPQDGPPPEQGWTKLVDTYGTRSMPPRKDDFAAEGELINHWASLVLAKRYTDLKQTTEGARAIQLTVDAAGKPDRDRLREVAKLASLIFSTTSTKLLTVAYTGATTVQEVAVSRDALVEWAKFNGDINQLGRFFWVDGKHGEQVDSAEPPFQKQRALVDVLADRGRMERHLPAGAQLCLGLMNGDRYNLAVIEAALPASQSFEEAWETYGNVVEKVFVEGKGIYYIDLILTRGGEIEYMRFDLSTWALRHYLMVREEMRLDPAYLPLTADLYTRYKRVD